MYTVSQVAKKTGLSRSTLLYYERIGLIAPEHNSLNDYRLYNECDLRDLSKICLYRSMGIPLKQIISILNDRETHISSILETQLEQLNKKINILREQQKTILNILKNDNLKKKTRAISKDDWINILKATGLSDDEMIKWHVEFEKNSPEAHQDFLESLGIDSEEIKKIRSLN
ncbi:MAG TPA: MerR family transcriptional regulator [Victivallales bacterium]|nr:MerR family transcriptional regulator [Victivallales bacterium]